MGRDAGRGVRKRAAGGDAGRRIATPGRGHVPLPAGPLPGTLGGFGR
jgi:hypothetical protein